MPLLLFFMTRKNLFIIITNVICYQDPAICKELHKNHKKYNPRLPGAYTEWEKRTRLISKNLMHAEK